MTFPLNRHFGAQSLEGLPESPSQTAGPYVHIGCTPNVAGIEGVFERDLGSGSLFHQDVEGERIVIIGRVLDGADAPLTDALVEIWQADSAGHYSEGTVSRATAAIDRSPHDPCGFGRCATDSVTGEFRFDTIKPGTVPYPDGRWQAPHITFWIVARGINIGLHTRMYFADEGDANERDPLLNRIEHIKRRQTLISSTDEGAHRFDIRLQGDAETVFLDI